MVNNNNNKKKYIYIVYIFIYLFIYLLGNYLNLTIVGLVCINAKERDKKERMKKKWIGSEVETIHPNPGN